MIHLMQTSQNSKHLSEPSAEIRQALARVFQQKGIGFFEQAYRTDLWLEAEQLGKSLAQKHKKLVVVGMGGSSLGPRALVQAVGFPKTEHRVLFLDNLDTAFVEDFFREHTLSDCVFVYVSKSGSTLETLALANCVLQKQKEQNLDFKKHSIAISELKSNPLSDWAKSNKLPLLEIPENVGGRFSVLTAVGLLPAAFMGYSLSEMQAGAKLALNDKEKVALFSQMAIESFHRQEWISFFWFYSSNLKDFGGWLQQLWAESLAKRQTRSQKPAPRVSTPMFAIGACDQHSLLQQVMDGHKDKWVVFVRTSSAEEKSMIVQENIFSVHSYLKGASLGQILGVQAECTELALAQNGVSTLTLKLPSLSPASLAYLFQFFELVVATIAESLDLNAYDQPGVELGKQLAAQKLGSLS
jgi:glucose-6-phosphate isomerase